MIEKKDLLVHVEPPKSVKRGEKKKKKMKKGIRNCSVSEILPKAIWKFQL